MKVILLKKIPHLGETGDIKEVAQGFARNYLIPRKLADYATKNAVSRTTEIKDKKAKKSAEEKEKIAELSAELNGKTFTLFAKAKKGTLFGSITAKEIAAEINSKGFAVQEKMIDSKEHLKKIGSYEISIKFSAKNRVIIYLTVKEK